MASKYFTRRLLAFVVATLSCASNASAQDRYRIIVNAANPIESLTKSQAARLFLTRTSWDSGEPAHPVDLAPTSPVRESFSRDVLGLSVAAAIEQWKRAAGPGPGGPPPSLASDREVLAFVRLKRGAIGYVSAAVDVQGVKVVPVANVANATDRAAGRADPVEVSVVVAPERQVQATLDRYVAGLTARSVDAIKRVWPTMSADHERAMRTEFGYARSVRAELIDARIDVTGGNAKVAAQRRYELMTIDGKRLEAGTFMTILLRDTGRDWVIEDIQHRSGR